MARAETIESVGEAGGGGGGAGNCPLPRHICRMELPRSLHTWPGVLTTTTVSTASGALHLHHHHHHLLHPLQPLHLLYALPDAPQTHQRFLALSPSPASPPVLLCNQREDRDGRAVKSSAFSGDESDSDQEASSQHGPLPDLLPLNEHPSRDSSQHRAPRRESVQELEVRRVATQLRTIGDQFNTTGLRRLHDGPYWQHWRDVCRGLLNFITQTLSTLYRLT